MTAWKISIAIFCTAILFEKTSSVPIVPLSVLLGTNSRSSFEDTNASIGPGLGGSPILVDTRALKHDR